MNPTISNDVLAVRIDYLTKTVEDLAKLVVSLDVRSRELETYVIRWKGASMMLLSIGALVGWMIDKGLTYFN
jgi:hypothetical protein